MTRALLIGKEPAGELGACEQEAKASESVVNG
mgnify:CR=1 FL=1